MRRFRAVGTDNGVKHLGEESEQDLIWSIHQAEARIGEDPVVFPICVPDPVLSNIARGRRVATVSTLQRFEVIESGQKRHLVQTARPWQTLERDVIKDLAPRYSGDSALV